MPRANAYSVTKLGQGRYLPSWISLANEGSVIPMVCPRAMSCVGAVEGSHWLSVLFSPESLTMTVSVAASGAFRDRIRDVLRPHVEAAKASGELREQLDPDAVADWLVRAHRCC